MHTRENIERVERRHELSAEELEREYIQTGTPVIITGILDTWPAMKCWRDLAYLKDLGGDRVVPLTHVREGGEYFRVKPVQTTFSDALDLIFDSAASRPYYLHEFDLSRAIPALKNDFSFPFPALEHHAIPPNFWIGSGGSISRLHYDYLQNFLAVVRGVKHLYLVSPEQLHRVYALPPYARKPNFSPVSIVGKTDLQRYPRAAHVQPLEVIVEEGEVLYNPSMWWHQVTTRGQTIAVNWFWSTPAMKRDETDLAACLDAMGTGDLDGCIERIRALEDPQSRSALRAHVTRILLNRGARDQARAVWQTIESAKWCAALRELFDGRVST